MDSQVASKGQQIFLGKPAKPLAQDRVDQLRALVSATSGVVEAHLPQCFIPGTMDSAAQVLFVVVASGANGPDVAERIGRGIRDIFPNGEFLDVIPLNPDNSLIASVRGAGCPLGIFANDQKQRPWWKVW